MKGLNVFIKLFEAPQRTVIIKIYVNFILMQLSETYGAGSVKKPGNDAVPMS